MIHSVMIVAVAALVTLVLRFIPFLIFGGKRGTPAYISYLGRLLPYAVMAMLVVYCLRNISFTSSPFGAPELISCTVVALIHVWKRSSILSILGGTVCYMLLVQLVF